MFGIFYDDTLICMNDDGACGKDLVIQRLIKVVLFKSVLEARKRTDLI